MSRRDGHQSGDAVTLFPFLAVLICTMGSLIVLLVVVVRQAQSEPATANDVTPLPGQATAPAPPAASPVETAETAETAEQQQAAELALQEYEELTWQADALRVSREKTLRRVKQQQQELSRLEDHARALRQRLAELEAEHQRMQQIVDSDGSNVADVAAELAELSGKIEIARKELEEAREAAKQRRRQYALVPYTGQQGTKRRPIYLECLGDAIVVQPEGVRLEPDDFLPPLGPDNALVSALRAAREYLLNSGAAKSSADAYPLLVVRPAGAQGYAACRNAMHGWDDEFGYELLPDDVVLAYPPPDPGLKAVLLETIELVRRRQQFMDDAQAAIGPVFAVASGRGGFVAQPGTGSGPTRGAGREGNRDGSRNNQHGGTEHATGANTHSNFDNAPAKFATATGGTPGPATGPLAHQPGRQQSSGGGAPPPPGTWSPAGGDGMTAGPVTGRLGGNNPSAADRESAFQPAAGGTSPDPSGGNSTSPPQGHAGSAGSDTGGGDWGSGGGDGGGSDGGGGGGGSRGGQSGGQLSTQVEPTMTSGGGLSMTQATPIAATHGVNWALPNASQGAIGITRPVLVTCTSDRLLIHSEVDNAAVDHTVMIESTMNDAVQSFVATLWKRIEDWGIAGAGVYWKPVLKVRVPPEGEDRFVEFVQLLDASGVEVIRRP